MKIKSVAALAFIVTGALSLAGAIVAVSFLPYETQLKLLTFFQEKMRQPLFAGFLTASTFLFSLKTFIVLNMKVHLYDTKKYEEKWREKLTLNSSMKRYQPLRNFALLLFLSVLISLICAVSQFTIGLVNWPPAAILCLSLAAWSISMIFVSLILLQMNLASLFQFLDDEAPK